MWIHSVTIQRRCIFNEIDLIYRPGEPLTMNTISTFYTNTLTLFKSESAPHCPLLIRKLRTLSTFDQKIKNIFHFWSGNSEGFPPFDQKIQNIFTFNQKIQHILQLQTLAVNTFSVQLHAGISFEPLWQLCKIHLFCICHNRSEFSSFI